MIIKEASSIINEGGKKQMQYTGKKVSLQPFTLEDITEEYIGWLNDKIVVQWSNQRFKQHSKKTAQDYLNSFRETENLFLAFALLRMIVE
jgi:hypothetical protein